MERGHEAGRRFWRGLVLVAGVLACTGFPCVPGLASAEDALCAKVKLEISQELALERQGFDAHLRINNGTTTLALENVRVVVRFSDEAGNPVTATSDPADQSDPTDPSDHPQFFVRLNTLSGVSAVDGTGSVPPSTSADIHWLIIPAPGAAKGAPQGTLYYVGATLSYTLGGRTEVTEVSPDYIYVKPMPQLALDYFLPGDVYGDDAFTSEIEPPIPFSLGLRVTNTGQGYARGVKIESGRPKILENAQGLLVGFDIAEAEVGGAPAPKSLLAGLGDVAPGRAAVARWTMTTSVSGRFTEFSASYTHSNELGGALTSLLQTPSTHLLVRDVLVDLPGRDAVRDFLARDGEALKLYDSERLDAPVLDLSAQARLAVTAAGYALEAPVSSGFSYLRLRDPFAGQKVARSVVRSDGKRIKLENAWLSKTRNRDRESPDYLKWEYWFSLFDFDSTGSYSVTFDAPAAQPSAPVLQFIPDRTVVEGNPLSFVVEATDPDGTVPVLSASSLPAGARFTDERNGVGRFWWTPAVGQAGRFPITFRASDGVLEARRSAAVKVNPVWDTDGDGLADAWERENFGDLSRNGLADSDRDGRSDLGEYLAGTDPLSDFAPTVPLPRSPLPGATVALLQPELAVRNAIDREGDPITYDFEVYADEELSIPVASGVVPEDVGSTRWTPPLELADNTRYFWRVRAGDGKRWSRWAYGDFFVNTANDPPGAPPLSAPADGMVVDTRTPTLSVMNATDPDGDAVSYSFEVWEDSALTRLVASGSRGAPGPDGSTSWQVDVPLADESVYYWRAGVTDAHGAWTESPVGSFRVQTARPAPPIPLVLSPVEAEVPESEAVLMVSAVPEATTVAFELDTVPTFNGPGRRAGTAGPVRASTVEWRVGSLADNTRYYWRAKASDGSVESAWTATATFFVNAANEVPAVPIPRNPSADGEISARAPTLEVCRGRDPDGDALLYEYEVYSDRAFSSRVDSAAGQGKAWTPVGLQEDRAYYWRVRALDEHGLASPWTDAARFFTAAAGPSEPPTVAIAAPGAAGAITNQNSYAISWAASDPDSDATVALYFDRAGSGYEGSLIAEGISEDATPATYTWDLTGLADGAYYVYAVIEDESTSSRAYSDAPLVVDRTPPITTADPAGNQAWSAGEVVVRLSAEDATSGVAATLYRLDGLEGQYTEALVLRDEGEHLLEYWSVDRAGNGEAPRQMVLRLDRSAPSTQVSLAGASYEREGLYVSAATGIVLTSVDPASGVALTEYRIDGGGWNAYTAPIEVTGTGGHTVSFRGTDGAGNVEEVRTLSVFVDDRPPCTEISVGSPTRAGSPLWVTSSTAFGLVAADRESGVAGTEYRIDAGPWMPYEGSFRLAGEGDHAVAYRSRDAVGNQEQPQTLLVRLDEALGNSAPTLSISGDTAVDEGATLALLVRAVDPDGDGVALSVAGLPPGASFDPGTGAFTWTPRYDQAGEYPGLVFIATDDALFPRAGSTELVLTVRDVNRTPVFQPLGEKVAREGRLIGFTVWAEDPDGDGVVLEASGLPRGATFDPVSGAFLWVPEYDQSGSYEVAFRATDDGGPPASAMASVQITVADVNRPPSLEPVADQQAREGLPWSLSFVASDPDGDALDLAAGGLPAGAVFTDHGDGTALLTWTPAYDQAGNYPDILIRVTDRGTPPLSASTTFAVSVGDVNRPPEFVLLPEPALAAYEGDTISFALQAQDPDGDPLTYGAANLPRGATFDSRTGTFRWTPGFDQAGNYPDVLFSAADDGRPSLARVASVSFSIGDVNRPPVLDPIGSRTVTEGETLTFVVTARDPDGDPLTYSAGNLPPGAAFDPVTQTFLWTPTYEQSGEYRDLEFTAADGGEPLEVDTELVTVSVGNVNRAPVFDAVPTIEVKETRPVSFTVRAVDRDGDRVAYAAPQIPRGATFDSITGAFRWVPGVRDAGTYVAVFTATDDGRPPRTATLSVVISVGDITVDELVAELLDAVLSLDLPVHLENAYLANLKKVKPFLDRNKLSPARSQITAFATKILEDRAAGELAGPEADELIRRANLVLSLIPVAP